MLYIYTYASMAYGIFHIAITDGHFSMDFAAQSSTPRRRFSGQPCGFPGTQGEAPILKPSELSG